MTVAMTKIEASVLEGAVKDDRRTPLVPAPITYYLADIFKKINPQDMHLHPYRIHLDFERLSHGLKTCHRHVFLTAFRVPS